MSTSRQVRVGWRVQLEDHYKVHADIELAAQVWTETNLIDVKEESGELWHVLVSNLGNGRK